MPEPPAFRFSARPLAQLAAPRPQPAPCKRRVRFQVRLGRREDENTRVDFAVHTDRPILSTGAYLDFKRHVGNLLEQGKHGEARMLWLSAVEVLHAPFVQAPLPLVDSGEIPHLQFAPCIVVQCARCDGSLGGFKFPFIGTWCRRAVLVQEGASAEEAWAAYHGCYEEDRLSEAMVAEAGSGLRAQDIIPIAGRVESGDLPFVSFRGFMGTWRRWSLGARRWTEPWPRESDSLARATAGRLLRGWLDEGRRNLPLGGLWALLLAVAFRGDATPGRYATEAMEHSGGDPGGSGEGLMSRVQEANVRAFRQKHGLLQDSDFGFAFEAFEDAVRAGGHFVAAEWARVRAEQQAHLLPAGAAVVEADPWRVTPVGPSTLRRPAVRLPTSNVGLRLRQNPDNAEAVGRRVNLLTEAFMKLGVLRPRRYDNPDRYADWQQAVRRLPQERVTQSEATTILNAVRTFQELSLFLAAGACRSQAVVVEPPMLLTLEGRIIEMQQARDPAWTAALSSWLVASGCLRYKHLCLSTPVKISREFFHGHCRKGKQSHNRQGFDWCAPARFSNGWHWADKWLEDYQGLAPEQHDKCGICFHPASGQAWPIREVQRDAEIVSLGDWQDKVEERVAMPFHYSGGKYALSMRTKMRAFLVAAKVADCETVTEEEAAQTTALKRRFSLSQLGEIFLTGHLKNGTALCPDFNTGECRQDPCAREHLCAMLQQTGRACGGRRPASECRAKRRMTEAKLRELGLPVPADPVEVGATRPAGAPSEAPAQKRRRILPPPLPIAPAGPMSSRPSAEELREAAAANRVVEVEDAEIGEVPASVDTRRPAEPAELLGNFLEIPECLDLNPADSKWDRLATVKSAQTPSLIYNNVRGGALFLAGIPTAVTAAAFPACSLQVVCFPERLAQRQGVPLSGAHVEYFAIGHADRRQEDWDRVWPLVRRSLYHGDVVIVHCMAGRHRAALAAAMWLAMLKGISLADRKLAGWVHQALASSSAGASEPECTGFMATARSQVHISTARSTSVRLAYPLTTSDKFEAIAWEQRFCRTCLSKHPGDTREEAGGRYLPYGRRLGKNFQLAAEVVGALSKEAFWVRYKLKFPTEVYPSDAAVSRASREMSKRLLCVTAVWKVKTLQWQLGTSSKKRKLGEGLWTEEPDDEQPGHQDWETYLDRLFTLLLAYALGGVKALDNAPPAKEEDVLGADTTKFVYVPLDVVMRYHARARRTSASLPYASRLAWLQQRDTEERADWVSRFRESNLTLGQVIKATYKADAHWVPTGPLGANQGAHPEGLPGLDPKNQRRVDVDNAACSWILKQLQAIGRGALRENPARSLHWSLPQEETMMESGLWYDTTYSACVFMSARCKHQRLRHNIHEIELIHPRECHHQHDTQGRHQFPSKEEAEYSATLAFAIAVSVSWWAVRDGHARLHVPRMPPLEACGRRQHWPRAMRSWAMTPLAITLGLPPLHPEERARLPTVVRVADVLADGKLPPDVAYVGQGHHSHRVPRSQWASPFVQGHTCTTDDWLPLYVDFVLANLQAELPALQGKRLACDCGPEADALAGMVFDATHPDAEASLPRVTGRRHRQARGSVVRAATIMGSPSDALKM
ncbi:unnamed protein product [Effrenium voratum]|nr:unnamed protein product [Effrenium voratum]